MTFSLAGRCARTGMLGAVVTTSSIAVGARCAFAAAGVGAAVGTTPRSDRRQLAVIDAQGRTAACSGANVKVERNEAHGRDCVAIANIVRSPNVPAAMVQAFEAEPGAPLAARLIAALEAGDAAGGEFKPLLSAGLVIAHREVFPYVDLRVDSDADPIRTLRRLWAEYAPVADMYVARAVHPDSVVDPA